MVDDHHANNGSVHFRKLQSLPAVCEHLHRSRRRHRLCENSSPAGDPGKTTSTVSIWRVFFGGEGSENPFFVLPKCHFGVFAQPGQSARIISRIRTGHWPSLRQAATPILPPP